MQKELSTISLPRKTCLGPETAEVVYGKGGWQKCDKECRWSRTWSTVDARRDGGIQDAASKKLMAVEWAAVNRKQSGGEAWTGPLPIQVLPEDSLEATASFRSIGSDGAGHHTLEDLKEVAQRRSVGLRAVDGGANEHAAGLLWSPGYAAGQPLAE